MHYCLGELSDVAIFSEAEVCNFEKYFGTPAKDGVQVKNKSCCGSDQILINGQSHQTTLKQEKLKQPIASILIKSADQFTLVASNLDIKRTHKNPPLIEPPIFLRVQSFRL
jgi:hypothetical protein